MRFKKPEKKKSSFSKFWVSLIVALNVMFAAAIIVTFWHTGTEPSSLVVAWFAFTTGELWMLAGIKKKKIKEGEEHSEHS